MAAKKITTSALTSLIDVLTPMDPDERRRTINAAMMFLENEGFAPSRSGGKGATGGSDEQGGGDHGGGGDYPTEARKWMTQNSISGEEIDRVIHFDEEGGFALLDVPGKSKREQTINAYILTGLGVCLAKKGERKFADADARASCVTIGCYDKANHSVTLREIGSEISGDKKKGYTITNAGLKRAAALVKGLAKGGEA